ncbi:putative 4-hydroxyphenylacetate permease domain protein [Acinetobacter baumannii 44298_5]|nr:putative 4-hydroxyphenylacetate permease domain protein [Acinetobacter baumannii 44298_5]
MEDIKNVTALEEQTIKRISSRIIPFLIILFIMAFLDRTNIGFAALHMNDAIGITQTIFGLGAGVFFLGYFFQKYRVMFYFIGLVHGSGLLES